MNQEIDRVTVNELDLYWSNDEPLYRLEQQWVKLYVKKYNKGIFNEELALKGIVNNFVPRVIRKYKAEFGLGKVNLATKTELGKEIMLSIHDDMKYELNAE
jgi:hypothetical protein